MRTEKETTRVSSFLRSAPALILSGIMISGALMAAATWAGSIAVNKQTAVTLTGTVSDLALRQRSRDQSKGRR